MGKVLKSLNGKKVLYILRTLLILILIYKVIIIYKQYYIEDTILLFLMTMIVIIVTGLVFKKQSKATNSEVIKAADMNKGREENKAVELGYQMEYALKKNMKNLEDTLQANSNTIITLNGKFGMGKSTIIKEFFAQRKEDYNIKHIELWNLDYNIDKTTFILNELYDEGTSFKSIFYELLLINAVLIVASESIFTKLAVLLYIAALIYVYRVQLILMTSKIKAIPFSMLSKYIWNELEDSSCVYVFEDIDRLSETDQIQIFEFISKLQKKLPGSKILISLSIENLLSNTLEEFHKLESKVISVDYGHSEDIIYEMCKILGNHTGADYNLYKTLWAIIEENENYRICSNWRFIRYCESQKVELLTKGFTNPIDFVFVNILDYYYGIYITRSDQLRNDPIVKEKIRILMEEKRCLLNTKCMSQLTHSEPADVYYSLVKYVGNDQIYELPQIFSNHISINGKYTPRKMRVIPSKNIKLLFESKEIISLLNSDSDSQEVQEKQLPLYDLIFQDIVMNYIAAKGISVSREVIDEKNMVLTGYISKASMLRNTTRFSELIITMIQNISVRSGYMSKSRRAPKKRMDTVYIYNDSPIEEELYGCKFDFIFNGDNSIEEKLSYLIHQFFNEDLKEDAILYQLACCLVLNPQLENYFSADSPIITISKDLRGKIGEQNCLELSKYIENPKIYTDIEYIINEYFNHSCLKIKYQIEDN